MKGSRVSSLSHLGGLDAEETISLCWAMGTQKGPEGTLLRSIVIACSLSLALVAEEGACPELAEWL